MRSLEIRGQVGGGEESGFELALSVTRATNSFDLVERFQLHETVSGSTWGAMRLCTM